MRLEILFDAPTLEEMNEKLNFHFNQAMKIHKEKLSLFESYQIRPMEKFVPEIWKYRIVCKGDKYYFGTV